MTTWSYNASTNQLSATFATTPGEFYELSTNDPNGGYASVTASGSSETLTATGLGTSPVGDFWDAYINTNFPSSKTYVDANVFKVGTTSSTGESLDATWTYDGTTGFSVEFAAPDPGHTYGLKVNYIHTGNFVNSVGADQTGTSDTICTVTAGSSIAAGTSIYLSLFDTTTFRVHAARIFVQGVSGAGSPGSPGGTFSGGGGGGGTFTDDATADGGAGGVRIAIAFDDDIFEPDPTWTFITDYPGLVASYTIERTRQNEFERFDTAQVRVDIFDRDGILDPTNTTGPFFTKITPFRQLRIELWNPVAAEWKTRCRVFIDDLDYEEDPANHLDPNGAVEGYAALQINCSGLFAQMARIEMHLGAFGDAPPAGTEGNVFFDNANVDDRIDQVIGNARIPVDWWVIFSGNVECAESRYAPADNPMTVIHDAAEAEMPVVANVYEDRFGRGVFHGRLAKFDPVGVFGTTTTDRWDFHQWKVGDGAAVAGSPTDTAHLRRFKFNNGDDLVRNSAYCTPAGIAEADKAGQVVEDSVSIGLRGYATWSSEDIYLSQGLLTGNDANTECQKYGEYIVTNYAEERNRPDGLTFRSMRPDAAGAAANWDFLCTHDISDTVAVTISHPGGGGFNLEPCFIEGTTEDVRPLNGQYADVTTTLDVSLAALLGDAVGLTTAGT